MSKSATRRKQREQSNKPKALQHPPFALYGRSSIADFVKIHFPDNGEYSGHVILVGKDWKRVHYERVGEPLENYFRNFFMMREQEYYITPNSFQGGIRDNDHTFGFNNVYFDFDDISLHKKDGGLTNDEALRKEYEFKLICSMIDTEYPPDLPKPNTVVFTGRGFGFWWALEQTSFRMNALFMAFVNELYARFSKWIMDEGFTRIEGDPCASKRPAGLARLPGSYNPKAERWGYFRILHSNRLNLRTTATELGVGFVDGSGRSSPLPAATGTSDFPPAAASARLDMLRGLIQLRAENGTLRGCRDLILYIACNSLQQVYSDPDLVMDEVFKLNDMFGADVFRVRTVRNYMSSSMRKHYAITDYKTKELLNITDEEMRLLNWSPEWGGEHSNDDSLNMLNSDCGKGLSSPEKEMIAWLNASAVSTEGMSVRMSQKVKRIVKERRNAAVKACLAAGEPLQEIETKFHISRATVYRVAKVEEPTDNAAPCAAQKEEKKKKENKINLTVWGAAKTIYNKLFLPIYTPIRERREALSRADFQERMKGAQMKNKVENNEDNSTPISNCDSDAVSKSNSDNIYNPSARTANVGEVQSGDELVERDAFAGEVAVCPNEAGAICSAADSAQAVTQETNLHKTNCPDFVSEEISDARECADSCEQNLRAQDASVVEQAEDCGSLYGIEHSSIAPAHSCQRRHPEDGEPRVIGESLRDFQSPLPGEYPTVFPYMPPQNLSADLSHSVHPNLQNVQKATPGAPSAVCEDFSTDESTLDGLVPPGKLMDSRPSDNPNDWPTYESGLDGIEDRVAPDWSMPEPTPEVQAASCRNFPLPLQKIFEQY